ncbi:hypothetical protein D9M71_311430 [compost metagenome]
MQQQFDGILDAYLAHEDGRLEVGAQVLVEDEVQPRRLRQHLEDDLQVGVAEFQVDRPLHPRTQLRIGRVGALADGLDALLQAEGALVAGVQREDGVHLALSAGEVAAAQVGFAVAQHVAHVAHLLQLVQGVLRAAVVRLDAQHPLVTDRRRGEIALAVVEIRRPQQLFDGARAGRGQRHPQLGVARIGLHRPGQLRQPLLVLPRLDQREPGLSFLIDRTAGQQHRADSHRQHCGIR